MSFLKSIGQKLGKLLGFLATNAKPIADQAAAVASVLLPQFAPEITAADNLVTKIAQQAVVTEALAATTATAPTGAAKLTTVLTNIGPEIDAWVANAFPGATAVSTAAKSGLVNAVVAIMNELQPSTASSAPVATTTPTAAQVAPATPAAGPAAPVATAPKLE